MAARNRAHVLSLRDPQPPILGRAPLPPPIPHHPHPLHPLDDPRRALLPAPPSHHHVLLLEERLNAQYREIHVLLTDNQRLAATHVALAQEVNIARHDLRVAAPKAASEEVEKDREVREVYERSLQVEKDLRGVEMKRAELAQVRADVEELVAAREELVVRLQGIKAELARARAEVQQMPALRAEIEKMQVEIQKGSVEYNVSYVYHAMFAYFDRDNVALRGMAKFFKESSEEEREHAEKFMKYQNMRGGRVKLQSIVMPLTEFDHYEKGDALYAMELALSLEKLENEKLLNIHSVAEKNHDVQMQDFIESEFLEEQVEAIKKISEYVSQLRRVGKGHGVWHFDQMLLHEGEAV